MILTRLCALLHQDPVSGAPVQFLDRVLLGNSYQRWLTAAALFAAVLLALHVVRWLIVKRLKRLAQLTENRLDDLAIELVERSREFFLVLMAAFVAAHSLSIREDVALRFHKVVTIGILLQAGVWAGRVVTFAINSLIEQKGPGNGSRRALGNVFGFISRVAVWSLVVILALDNLGVDVTAGIAGLGVGGIAVALALQNVLGDLFGSLTIVLDRPFEIGDTIHVGEFVGTVERIGLKNTRLRSLSGEELVVANSDLLQTRLRNYKRMQERRAVFTLGVVYQTPAEKLQRVPGLLREIVAAVPHTRFDRAHFKSYGDFALLFEVVYYVASPDYNVYMDTQQKINFEIFRRFAAEGIEFAYPTQTVFVVKQGAPA